MLRGRKGACSGRPLVGRPLSITCGATGACFCYLAQANLPRMCRSTVNTPGSSSSSPATSLPMRFISQPQLHVVLCGSWQISRAAATAPAAVRAWAGMAPLAHCLAAPVSICSDTAWRVGVEHFLQQAALLGVESLRLRSELLQAWRLGVRLTSGGHRLAAYGAVLKGGIAGRLRGFCGPLASPPVRALLGFC